jgi:hypothetical protein
MVDFLGFVEELPPVNLARGALDEGHMQPGR